MVAALQSLWLLAGFYLIYSWLLSSQHTLKFNRFFLILSFVFSIALPFFKAPSFSIRFLEEAVSASQTSKTYEQVLETIHFGEAQLVGQSTAFEEGLVVLYILIAAVLTLRFAIHLIRMFHMMSLPFVKEHGVFVHHQSSEGSFSFFRHVFLARTLQGESQLAHELVHAKQWHSADVLFAELMCCLLWFNPFAWLTLKAMKQNHEYLADRGVISQGIEGRTYMQELLRAMGSQSHQRLSSGFSFKSTKKRIQMINSNVMNTSNLSLRIAVSLILSLVLLSFKTFDYKGSDKPLRVVIDAGHGGKDPGAVHGEWNEKAITLEIAEMVQKQLKKSNIEVILSRNTDEFYDLQSRVEKVNGLAPDLMLSLHVNDAPNNVKKGVEAYYFKGAFEEESKTYSELLVREQLIGGDLGLIQEANFYVLKNTNCPSVVLELGFFSNEDDYKRLTSKKGRKDIAKRVVLGLQAIQEKY